MVGARVRRPQVAYARARGLSGRRACALLSVARSTLGYQSRLVDRDAPALAAMRRLAAQYPRYGYRRIRIFLKREGHTMSTDRTHRLWRQAGLQVPRRRPRRRVALSRPRPVPATAVNHVWAYDFVFDTCREWADAQVPHRRRRMDPRVTRDRRGRRHSVRARYRGAHAARERPRSPTLPPVRQRPRVCRGCDSPVAAPGADRNRAHRAGEAVAECDRRIVQREVPRRVSEPAVFYRILSMIIGKDSPLGARRRCRLTLTKKNTRAT